MLEEFEMRISRLFPILFCFLFILGPVQADDGGLESLRQTGKAFAAGSGR
jgi:hypothetical protein